MTLARVVRIASLMTLLLVAACGDDDAAGAIMCTGATCSCPAGERCGFDESSCGASGSCTLDCQDMNTCSGTCGESCSIGCAGMSTCDVTVGKSGSVSCGEGSTCHVTCTGSCSVSCSGGSICDLTCPSFSAPISIPGGGECP